MKIRVKLFLMLLLPLVGMFGFSAYLLWEKWHVVDEMQVLGVKSGFSVTASVLTHELQKERGMSAGYIGSRGEKFARELDGQRAVSDRKAADLKAYLEAHPEIAMDAEFSAPLGKALADIGRLAAVRKSISALGMSGAEAIGYYTGVIDGLLHVVEDIAGDSPDSEVGRTEQAYAGFLQAKERVGRERALLNGAFAAGKFAPGAYEKFLTVVAEHDTFLHVFLQNASPAQIEFYKQKMKDKAVEEVASLRAIAVQKATSGNFGVEPKHWFDTITHKIELFKQVENRLADDIGVEIARHKSAAWTEFGMVTAVTLISLGAALVFALVMLRGISRQIGTLHATIGQIERDSDLSLRVQISSSDEIGDIARALNTMLDKFHSSLSQVSDSTLRVATAAEELSAVTDPSRALVLIVNTCGFISQAKDESLQALAELAAAGGDPDKTRWTKLDDVIEMWKADGDAL